MKNKRYKRLAKRIKSNCTGNCNGGKPTICKYYGNCYNGFLVFPQLDSIRELEQKFKGQILKYKYNLVKK